VIYILFIFKIKIKKEEYLRNQNMASRTKGRPGSPLKKQASQSNNNNNVSHSQMLHDDYDQREMLKGLTEREVENDHLRTTIIALSEQVAVSIQIRFQEWNKYI
jgi:hypothetical protein